MLIGRYDEWARMHRSREIEGWVLTRQGVVVGSGRLDRQQSRVNATRAANVRRVLKSHMRHLGVRLTTIELEHFSRGYTPVMVGETTHPSSLFRSRIHAILGQLSPEGWALKVTDPAGATIFFTGRSSFVGVGMTWIAPWLHRTSG